MTLVTPSAGRDAGRGTHRDAYRGRLGSGGHPINTDLKGLNALQDLSCTYSVMNSWSGGFQAQVVISNAGANVTVANEPYNGSISPGSSVTIGFTASGTAPSSLSITR
jgi:hypothetical protein